MSAADGHTDEGSGMLEVTERHRRASPGLHGGTQSGADTF